MLKTTNSGFFFSAAETYPATPLHRARCVLVVLSLIVLFPDQLQSQTNFQNLGFESANNLPALGSGQAEFIPIGDAFPGWVGYVGGTQTTQAIYNGVSLGAPLVSLIGEASGFYTQDIISGNYTASIDAGSDGVNDIPAALAQTALVPGFANSLLLDAGGAVTGDLTVTFNGQLLSYYPLSSGQNYEEYGVDVSTLADQTGELRFTEISTGADPTAIAFLDNIAFSHNPIPEPSLLELLCCGVGLLGIWRKLQIARANRCNRHAEEK